MATLEERKQELVGLISKEQDHKLKRARSLIRRYSDELEAAVALVESAIRSMEEPHMSAFIQVGCCGYPGNAETMLAPLFLLCEHPVFDCLWLTLAELINIKPAISSLRNPDLISWERFLIPWLESS